MVTATVPAHGAPGTATEKARTLLLDVIDKCSRDRWSYFPAHARDVRGGQSTLGLVVFGLRSPTWCEHLRAIELVLEANPWLEIRALVDDESTALEECRRDLLGDYALLSAKEFFESAHLYRDCLVIDRYCTWVPGVRYAARFKQLGMPYLRLEQFLNAPSLENVAGFYRDNSDFLLDHANELLKMESIWADERSRETYYTTLAGFISMDFTYFALACDDHKERYFPADVGFGFGDSEVLVDCGSNDGGEIRIFGDKTNHRFHAVHAFEPDRQNFSRLCRNMAAYMAAQQIDNVYCYPLGVFDRNDYLRFSGEGTIVTVGGERAQGRNGVFVTRLDDIVDEVTYLRLEVEGAEVPALRGAHGLIQQCRPKLAVSAYHRPNDFMTIYRTILEMDLGYEFRLRHQSLEAGVLCIYCR